MPQASLEKAPLALNTFSDEPVFLERERANAAKRPPPLNPTFY